MTEGCIERFDPEFEEWILNFESTVKPEMMNILKDANIPYKIFATRQETELWMNSLS